ncbi:MAG: sterol desaturase family protein [Polaromonas sp.]
MSAFLVAHEAAIRLLAFVGIFAVMALWEFLAPRRARTVARRERWPGNLSLVALNTLVVRLILPTSAVSLALLVEARQGGVLPWLGLPPWLVFGLALVLLDLAIYLQHVLFHAVPFLWRPHRMHHADVDVDVTNGLRFHSLEIVLSMGLKFALIAALGPPAAAVVVFEVLLNGLAVFNHANVRIAEPMDRGLRWLIVTPDMHRIHHSWHTLEHNKNFGFNLTWWDRLFGTYLAQPRDGQTAMTFGLPVFREPEWRRLDRMLVQPFVEATVDQHK